MWVSKRFDLSWNDLLAGLAGCVRPGGQATAVVERLWSTRGDAIACLSVRSGFDLFCGAADFPEGTEIVFTAMTIGDMPRIAQSHDLTPIPCDVDPETMMPRIDALERACTPHTRAIVVTHLFGARLDVSEVLAFARGRGLLLIEDCAQAYCGLGYSGHPEADLTMFSFGPIKHATALGGALLRVRDPDVRSAMRDRLERQPRQSSWAFAMRLIKYAILRLLSLRGPYTVIWYAARTVGVDPDRLANRLTRGFAGRGSLERIRRGPSVGLVRLLRRRLVQETTYLKTRELRGRSLLGASATQTARAEARRDDRNRRARRSH